MANKIDPKLWEYGEWLVNFFNDGPKDWPFRQLAREAIEALEIENYNVNENDSTFSIFEWVNSHKRSSGSAFEAWDNAIEELIKANPPQTVAVGLIDSEKIYKYGFDTPNSGTYNTHASMTLSSAEIGKYLDQPKYVSPSTYRKFTSVMNSFSNNSLTRLYEFKAFRDNTRKLLKVLLNYSCKWEEAIAKIAQKIVDHDFHTNYFDLLVGRYGYISRLFVRTEHEFRIVNGFNHKPKFFPWYTVASVILLEFLRLGGQYRYGFCNRCDSFYLVMRQGRKKFCSDLCRVLTAQEE